MYFINVFLFYSILGNFFERILMFLRHTDYVSGFMGTIFTPVYGIAILTVIIIHDKLKIKNKYIKILIEFIIYGIVLSLLELIGGILIENVFNKIYWNYDRFKFNIGKYISLETSTLWGLMSLFTVYFIQPIFKKIESHIPKLVTILFSIFFIINLIIVLIVKLT